MLVTNGKELFFPIYKSSIYEEKEAETKLNCS